MSKTIKILHLEDVESDSNIVKRELQKSGMDFEYLWVLNKAGFGKALLDFLPDVIISDHSLPSFTSTDAIKMVKENGKRIPFIVVTATMSEEFAVETMKTGVDDYLLKDRLQRLPNAITNALDKVNSEIDKAKYYREIVKREKKFRELIENISDGIVLIDERGCLLYQSPSATRITNYTTAEAEGKVIYQFLHHDDIAKAMLLFEKVFLNPQTPIPFTLRMLHKNGGYIWVEGTITNLLGDVSVKGLILNYRDITKKRADERLLQKSEANLRTIFENTAISYVLTDKNFNIVSFNKLAVESYKTDMKAEIVEGKNLIDYLPAERKESGRMRYELVLQGRTVNYEIDFTREDGSVAWYNINIFPVYNDKREILGIIVSSENITERKRLEIEKDKMTADIVQRNQDLEQFAYIISHNLRSPVANIIGLSNLILETPYVKKEDHTRLMKGLSHATKKLDEVITDLNYILQVRREINEKKENVRFSKLVKDITESISSLIEKENVQIETFFEEADELFTIKSYLNSIFYNLISNSIRYRKPASETVLRIKSYIKNKTLFISFTDNGLGIDMERHGSKIFGLYKKFHEHTEGKGMGLYMVKTQVEILGGRISVKSEVNKGTEFLLEFDLD